MEGQASAIDYQKVLSSITANDGKLLQPSTVLEMIKPLLSPESRQAFMNLRTIPGIAQFTAQGQVAGAELDYGLGSCLNLKLRQRGVTEEPFPDRVAPIPFASF